MATTTTDIYTLSLHDALPISLQPLEEPRFDAGTQVQCAVDDPHGPGGSSTDRKSTRLNSSHVEISYAVFCLKKKIAGRGLASLETVQRRLPEAFTPMGLLSVT